MSNTAVLGPDRPIEKSSKHPTLSNKQRAQQLEAFARDQFFRVGSDTSQNLSTWLWSVVTDHQINHMPKADAGAAQTIAVSGGVVPADVVLDGSPSSDPDAGSRLNYVWSLRSPPASCFDPAFLSTLCGAGWPGVPGGPRGPALVRGRVHVLA